MTHVIQGTLLLTLGISAIAGAGDGQTPQLPDTLRPTGLTFVPESDLQKIPLASIPLTGTLPASVDLSSNLPEPADQGQQGSCVGFAVAYALKSYQEMIERHWHWGDDTRFSPAYVYNAAKLSGDCNTGAFYTDALEFVKTSGAAPLSAFRYVADSCSAVPSASVKQDAVKFRIVDYRRVNPGDDFEMRGHLAGGQPVLIGMKVDRAFMNLGQSIYQGLSGPVVGGHAMAVVGYDDARGAYKVINSWGTSWGTGGYGWISYGVFAPERNTVPEAYVVTDLVENEFTAPQPPPPPLRQGPERRIDIVRRHYASLGIRSETLTTGNHHCASNCDGEPTRTPYTLALTAKPGHLLRDPKLVCEGASCPWSAVSYVRLQDKGARAEAGWSVWSKPTIWRLEAEEVAIEDYARESRVAKVGETLEVETAAGDAPPEVSRSINGKPLRVGPGTYAPEAGIEYLGRQEREGKAVFTFKVVGQP